MKTLRNQLSNIKRTHKETERVSDRYRKNGELFSEVLLFPNRTHRTYVDDIALEMHAKFTHRVECLQGEGNCSGVKCFVLIQNWQSL